MKRARDAGEQLPQEKSQVEPRVLPEWTFCEGELGDGNRWEECQGGLSQKSALFLIRSMTLNVSCRE